MAKKKSSDRKKKVVKVRSKKSTPKALQHADFLKLLGSAAKSKKRRGYLIDFADKSQLDAIMECIFNVLHGHVPVTKDQLNRLRPHRATMHALANSKLSQQHKRRRLHMSGGFLGKLLPLAVHAIGKLFGL